MLDQIRRNCALLLSENFATHSSAYLRLREAPPFRRVLEKFRQYELNLFDVAALLTPGSSRPMTDKAVAMLTEEVKREADALRDTVPL